MSTRVATSPLIARPTVSPAPWARRYSGSSNCRSFSLMNMPLKIKRTFGGARGHFFRKARSPLLGRSGLWRSAWRRAAWHKNAITFVRECRHPPFRIRWDSKDELSIMMKFTKPRPTSLELA
jgi:hypothetical protein